MPPSPKSQAARFAANIVRLREERGWSKEEAAWACGIHHTAFGRIESGERKPTLLTIFKLARGFEVPTARLFDGVD